MHLLQLLGIADAGGAVQEAVKLDVQADEGGAHAGPRPKTDGPCSTHRPRSLGILNEKDKGPFRVFFLKTNTIGQFGKKRTRCRSGIHSIFKEQKGRFIDFID